MRKLLVLLFALALVAFGCGDDDDDTGADGTTTTESEDGDTTTTESEDEGDPEADEAAAEEINLTEADLAGWTASPAAPDDESDEQVDTQMRECVGLPPDASETETADVDSDDFTQGQNQISSNVTFLTTEELAEEQRDAYASDKAQRCVEDVFGRFLTEELEGVTVDELSVERLPAYDLGDGGFAYRLNLALSAQGEQASLVFDFRGILVGRAGLGLTTLGFGTPVDEALQEELMGKMVERAEQAA